MWWESDELAAFASRDQYMVGKDLVVAPVVNKGKKIVK
jgi:alpha-glucosidase (family GH31 glycosyl hydrolase)